MWKSILSFFWGDPVKPEAALSLDEAYNVMSECEPSKEPENEEEVVEELRPYEVSIKVGEISSVTNDTVVIDNLYRYQTDLRNISVGTKISYRVIQSESDSSELKVVDVHILENDWDVVVTGKRTWHERVLVLSVSKREGRVLTLEPGNVTINLNEVCSEFVPVAGDWVELNAKCEFDENVLDLNGKIIEIGKLQPVRAQVKLGHVTQWSCDSNTGIVDRNIFFDKDSLCCGYTPARGDKVVTEIIDSDQGRCTRRALKVIPDHLQPSPNKDKAADDALDNHESLRITDDVSLTFTNLGETKMFQIEISPLEEVELVCIELPKSNGQCCLVSDVSPTTLEPNQPLTVRFECRAKCAGETREIVIFSFRGFKIKRWIKIFVVSRQTNPSRRRRYCSEKRVVPRIRKELINGQRVGRSARFVPCHIPQFAVPERLLGLLAKRLSSDLLKDELEQMKPCLASTLNYVNFEDKFHTLLHLDEIHMMLEMQNYDKERTCFIKNGEYLLLEIDNLAERRPSVIVGDRVIARSLSSGTSPDYEGYIHKISKNHVSIKFAQIFHDAYDGEDYSVYVKPSRTTYRRRHFAVNLAVRNLGKDWLFPTSVAEKEPQLLDLVVDPSRESNNAIGKRELLEKIRRFRDNGRRLEWYNEDLNRYQKEAVKNILWGVSRPLPYVIFGPPGTGKTVTVVETVLQILRLIPHSRILVSAPSNSAADLLALRLIDSGVLKPGDLVRLVAFTAIASIPTRLAPYCATASVESEGTETGSPVVAPTGLVLGCNSKVIGRHRITVCTCTTAGVLHVMGFSRGHFSHVIVDEAGQTSEPDILIPLAFLDTSSGQAVLAGDPMQLGPVVLSRLAQDYGLEESFLERMISRFPYARDPQGFPNTSGYDPRLITKLLYNYRALPDLVKLPSVLFYNDELIPTLSESNSREAGVLNKVKDILPIDREGKTPSLVFHTVVGENFQSEESPSWFNPSEASQVFYYVNECYRSGLTASDIGIITPYKAQIKQLMELFGEAEFETPKVGTVEEFQGQEFNVLIMSTVRSSRQYIAVDVKYTMGFIANPRRLNVAITRAKSLLIIVGNSDLLSTDRCWRSVINYCSDKGGCVGSTLNAK